MKRIEKALLVAVIALSIATGGVKAEAIKLCDFTDIPTQSWYYSAVEWAVEQGLFYGTSASSFSPNAPMTRAMFVTVLGRMAGVETGPNATPFTDVPAGAYYTPYVRWAAEKGIVTGTSEAIFSPDASITREQVATILWRYYGEGSVEPSDCLEAYSDWADISPYAVPAMRWTLGNGILQGHGGHLDPKETATRAQIAAILQRVDKLPGPPAESPKLAQLRRLVEEQLPASSQWDERALSCGWYGPMTLRANGSLENIAKGCVYLLTELDGVTYDVWYLTEPEQGSFVCHYG